DFCGNRQPFFSPRPLGEKWPTYDLLVELTDVGAMTCFFLAQVKAPRNSRPKSADRLNVGVKQQDIERMVTCPLPTYVIGVDEPAEVAYIASIHGSIGRPVSSIPTKYPLNAANLKTLWTEVKKFWDSLDPGLKTSVFTL